MADEHPDNPQPAPEAPATEAPQNESADQPPSDSDELAQIRAALKKANKEAETSRLRLKEFEDRDLSELQKAQRDAADAKERLAQFEQTTLRQRVALEKGLPASLVGRLQGSTEEEMAADADTLMALLGKTQSTPRPDPGQGPRPSTPAADEAAEYERYYPVPTRK